MNVEIAERSVRDLTQDVALSAVKLRALERNPFLSSVDSLGKIVGLYEGREIGGEYVFPVWVKAKGRELCALAGSTLSVEAAYRKSGLGMDLPELRWQKSPSGIALGAGLSQMAVPVHQLLDYAVFFLPRYMFLCKSRSVVEMKLKGLLARLTAGLVDVLLAVQAGVIGFLSWFKMRGVEVVRILPEDSMGLAEVAQLIKNDSHEYAEVHDEKWLRWHLTESFSEDGPAQLYLARRQGGAIGFWMTKRRFHAQASRRGFKNVWLGSIIEWQVTKEEAKFLPWFMLAAALGLRRSGVDAVELPTDETTVQRFLRRLGWHAIGEGNFVIKAGSTSPVASDLEMKVQANWRLRPAMGDNGLS